MARSSRRSPSVPPLTRVALVTGGAKRMGRTIALALAAAGWDVAIHYQSSRREAETVADRIRALGRRAITVHADLSDADATRSLVSRTAEDFGPITCIVNNASLFEADEATTVDTPSLERHMRVNLAAPLLLAQSLHRSLRRGGRGVVINLLDQKLFNPNPDFLSYTLSKAALMSATTLLAQALAPKLRIVGIAPGISLPSGDQSRREFAKAHARTPLGRSSTPDDIASAVCFAADAKAITGSVLLVDGGQHLVPTERDVMFVSRG